MTSVAPSSQPSPPKIPAAPERRGVYGELKTLPYATVPEVLSHFAASLPERICRFDHAGRGDAINFSLYGHDPDQGVAVVQIRHAHRTTRAGYLNLHRSYVLCGQNELTGAPFRHPVSAHTVRAAVRAGADAKGVVAAAQQWMWMVTPAQLAAGIRQGDVLLVPQRRGPREIVQDLGSAAVVGGSHKVRALRIVVDAKNRVWADSPSMYHEKGQHDPIFADRDGWHTVRVAREVTAWSFAERLGD